MSGICAVWRKEHGEPVAETLASITRGLALDSSERVRQEAADGAGVGVSSRFGTQQIYISGRVLVACDADLINQDELRGLVSGREPSAGDKTAALMAALYEQFGTDFVEKLQGGFSLVLWDKVERRLVAAIDGFGIKRLAYYQDHKGLLIATRTDALARSGHIDVDVNPRAIANVLNFTANLGPETVFTKVRRMGTGEMLIASNGNIRSSRYWDMRYGMPGNTREAHLSRELEAVVEQSVKAHCKSDSFAEVGAFLSGGTDSSTVVGMMSRMGQGRPKAFSIGFQEQPFNELGYAEIAARKFNAEHYTHLVGPEDCFQALPQMVRYFDEPFANSSAIPTYFCLRLAAEHGIKVLLAGDGGDELFGGNERYAVDKIFAAYENVPRFLRTGLLQPVLNGLGVDAGLLGRARRYIRRASLPPMERFLCFQILVAHSAAEIFESDFLKVLNGYSVLDVPTRHYEQAPARDHLDRLLYVDMKITLADNDLPKVTCMSELAGVESRFPFLDRHVAEFSGRVPARLKVKGFQKRYLFKKAFRNLLPAEIIEKKKHGFGIPVATWIKTDPHIRELARDTLLSSRAFERGYFRRDFIEDLFRKNETEDSSYYGDNLWSFLALELWHRQVVDEPAKVTA